MPFFFSFDLSETVIYNHGRIIETAREGPKLYYLGTPRIGFEGRELKPGFRKALALLVYLTLAKEKRRRESLMNLLWPDDADQQARAALRHAIYSIRKLLPGMWLSADRNEIGLLAERQ